MQTQEQERVDEGVNIRNVQSDLKIIYDKWQGANVNLQYYFTIRIEQKRAILGTRLVRQPIPKGWVVGEGHEEQRSPEQDVGGCDDEEHPHPLDTLAFNPLEVAAHTTMFFDGALLRTRIC